MMLYKDRIDAGNKLAASMHKYKNMKDTIVLGLARGGIIVAYEVAQALGLPLDITCPRKIGAPYNPEYAIGAITETGQGFFNYEAIETLGVSDRYIQQEVEKETKTALHRVQSYRKNLPPRNLKGKTVILIDDGIATGATLEAAIASVKSEGAKKIVVAVPVAPPRTLMDLKQKVDEVICLMSPSSFYAIGQFYEEFSQVTDEEVMERLH